MVHTRSSFLQAPQETSGHTSGQSSSLYYYEANEIIKLVNQPNRTSTLLSLNQEGNIKDRFCVSSSKRKENTTQQNEFKKKEYERNLLSTLEDTHDDNDSTMDEEVEEETLDPQGIEKLMPIITLEYIPK